MAAHEKVVSNSRLHCIGIAFAWNLAAIAAVADSQLNEAAEMVFVKGRVVDFQGKAIAGATVEWGRVKEPFRARQRVTTDDEGTYELILRSHNRVCHIAASAPGYVPQTAPAGFQPGRHERNFTLQKNEAGKFVLSGTVVDERGKPIEGARVEAFTPMVGFYSSFSMPTGRDYFPGPDRVDTTDKEGRFRIENVAENQAQLSVAAKHRHVNDDNYPVRENLRIVMSGSGRAGVLQGQLVETATGEPLSDVGDVRIVQRYSPTSEVVLSGNGRFQLKREVTFDNEYLVYVYGKRFAAREARITAVKQGSEKFAKIELTDGPLLRGKLVDADTGRPIAGARVLYGLAEDAHYFEWSSFDTYADGHHSLRFVQHDVTNKRGGFWFAEPEGESRGAIIVFAEGYARLMLKPVERRLEDSTGELVIRMERESVLAGVVRKDGKPLPGASVNVQLYSDGRFHHMFESVRTDSEGRFRAGRLAPGRYFVSGGPYTRLATVGNGETATVNLGEDLGPIRIHGTASGGSTITARPEFEWHYRGLVTKANDSGEYELRGLKPGKYRVSLHYEDVEGFVQDRDLVIAVRHDDEQIDLVPKAHVKAPQSSSADDAP